MSPDPVGHVPVTVEDWVALPETDGVKYELDEGDLYLMTGGTLRHALVAGAVARVVSDAARRDGCRTYQSDARLVVGERGYFPDVMVVCEPMDSNEYETRPCLVVEVMSPSTRRIDRTVKLDAYRSIPALRAYLVVAVDEALVEMHRRRDDETFETLRFGSGERVTLECPATSFAVDELYRDLPA